jgi:hypothetical protein
MVYKFVIFLFFLIVLSFSLLYSQEEQTAKDTSYFVREGYLKPKKSPDNMVMLNDSVYISVRPVTNMEYMGFVNYLKISYSQKVIDSLDNIPLWGVDLEEFRRFMILSRNDKNLYEKMQIRLNQRFDWGISLEEYITLPEFSKHPVILITHEQAKEYAQWLTRMMLFQWSVDSKNERQRKKYYSKIECRLPTPEEWDKAMEIYRENITEREKSKTRITYTFPVKEDRKKPRFIYVPGNISEMTDDKNIAVGVSWIDKNLTENNQRIEYKGTADWLGFRCVCVVKEY